MSGQQAEGAFMSTRNDYSADEWKAISAAPVAAGLLIALSDTVPSRLETRELETGAVVVGRAIARSTFADAPEIAKVLANRTRRREGRVEVPAMARGDRAGAPDVLIGIVSVAVRAVGAKSPAELEPFKTWLAAVAARVFHAAQLADAPADGEAPLPGDLQDRIELLAGVLGACEARRPGSGTRSRPAASAGNAVPQPRARDKPAAAPSAVPGRDSLRIRPST
jgi:hypothetical protein